jgi:DNA uptake protein ComE-like DNA-binding protein
LIDINSASAATLQTLPGISKAQAERIVAGRPYGSKAWLVSDKLIDEATYQAIRTRIVAKQPYKDGAKNAALYKDRKPKSEAK